MDTLYCTECGSTHVCYQSWFYPNTGDSSDGTPDLSDEDNCWCDDCEEHVELANLAGLWEMYNGRVYEGVLIEAFLTVPKGALIDVVRQWFKDRCPNNDLSTLD